MYAGQILEVRESSRLHDDPLHPYTAAIAAARPEVSHNRTRLRAIKGNPLSAFEAPPGECAFAPRCPHAKDECRAVAPELVALDDGACRCLRAVELRGRLLEYGDD
jgi:oligopeptide/dipeptide ABC transporter ATP-binding protein